MATKHWLKFGSGNGLCDGTNLDLSLVRSQSPVGNFKEVLQPSVIKISMKIAYQIFYQNLFGANEWQFQFARAHWEKTITMKQN